jgi:hypothetical protein
MRPLSLLSAPLAFAAGLCVAGFQHHQHEQGWVRIFDGKSLKGWTPKIKGYAFGENFGNTFRVKDGVIQVGYEGYGGEFRDRFGHLFHEAPHSNYLLRLEYRFTGDQVKGGPGWAWRNSGVMIHGQSPESMTKDQDLPVSAEVQLLGGPENGERHTGNVCTPGTNIVYNGKLWTQHCTDSNSPTFRGDQWVQLEIEVHGNGKVIHRINGKDVISYSEIQYDPNDADAKRLIKDGKLAISGGSISLQSESHPVEFRNIEIKEL